MVSINDLWSYDALTVRQSLQQILPQVAVLATDAVIHATKQRQCNAAEGVGYASIIMKASTEFH